jgi:predicted nuclease with TOPRIM domain
LKLKLLQEVHEPKSYEKSSLLTELKRYQSTCEILEQQMKALRKESFAQHESFQVTYFVFSFEVPDKLKTDTLSNEF